MISDNSLVVCPITDKAVPYKLTAVLISKITLIRNRYQQACLSFNAVNAQENLRLLSSHSINYDCSVEPVLDIMHIKDLVRRLGLDIVDCVILKTKGNPPKSSDYHVRTLRLIVDYLLKKHQLQFADMVKKMKIGELGEICQSFVASADKLFLDGGCNWGRIVALYAYAASLAGHCASNHVSQDLVRKIGETVGNYVCVHLTDWICIQGGWVSIV